MIKNIHIKRLLNGLKYIGVGVAILLLIPVCALLFKPLTIIAPILMVAYLIGWQVEVDNEKI